MTGLSIRDTIEEKLQKLKMEFPEIGDFAMASVADETTELIEKNYMSGQVLSFPVEEHSPLYGKKKPGEWKVTGRLFNLFEKGKRVVSNYSGQSIDTGLVDKREILKPAGEDMQSRIEPVLERVLKKQKLLKEIID